MHFSVDPGPDFVFCQDEYYSDLVTPLIQMAEPARHLGLLNAYMELVSSIIMSLGKFFLTGIMEPKFLTILGAKKSLNFLDFMSLL